MFETTPLCTGRFLSTGSDTKKNKKHTNDMYKPQSKPLMKPEKITAKKLSKKNSEIMKTFLKTLVIPSKVVTRINIYTKSNAAHSSLYIY